MPNSHRRWLTALALAGSAALAGCAVTGAQDAPGSADNGRLAAIAGALPGHYAGVADENSGSQTLLIERRSSGESGHLALELRQSDGQTPARRFGLTLEAGGDNLTLSGTFSPLDENGRPRASCAMQFHLRDGGLVGRTSQRECRFGEGDNARGLLKEIAFDGRKLVIGDRIVRLQDQETTSEQVLTFLPARHFQARTGRRDGGAWRVSRDLALRPGGAPVQPVDAADMALGINLALDYFRPGRNGPILLRLSVTDSDSGDPIAESWADADANALGVTLPSIQVGVERKPQPGP